MKKIGVFILFSLMLICFSGCTPKQTQSNESMLPTETVTLTDGLGRVLRLNLPAQRIVSLAPSNTELLFYVGAGSQVVGRDSFSDFPEAALLVEDIGGSMGQYDYEAIAALQPDLILAAQINTPEQVKAIEDLGLKVFYLSNPVKLDSISVMITTVGILTGRDKEAAALTEEGVEFQPLPL